LLGLILFSLITLPGLYSYIIKPTRKLITEINYIAETSKIERHININSSDEIGVLANSYNKMLDTLSKTYNDLKKSQSDLEIHKNNLELLVQRCTISLQETNEKLTIEINERIQALNELVIAKEEAEKADKIKSAFLATMSHELRTPLNSIIGFTGIILQGIKGPLNNEQKKQLTMVRASSQHLLSLINDILDISKIEAGQLQLSVEEFDLKSSIKKIIESTRPLAEKKGLSILYTISNEINFITGDQRRFEQILLNLISNAIKFTDKGSVTIECFIEDNQIQFRINDTGIGIKSKDIDTIFQPFHQIDSGLTRKFEGTGLGLSICKKLIEQMGGKIWIVSTWGMGSTFCFSIPIGG